MSMFTIKQLEEMRGKGKIRGYSQSGIKVSPEQKRAKYGNKKTEVDGILFDSKREANRYFDLKVLQLAGEITELKMQVPYQLSACKYFADFVYKDKQGKIIVEDTKGFRTQTYQLKKKLMKNELGITITEI